MMKGLNIGGLKKIVKSSLLVTFRNLKGRKLAPQNPLIKLGFESAGLLVDQLHFNVKKGHFVIFAYIHANIRMAALKNHDLSQLCVWKKAVVHFSPFKVALFAEKNQVKVKSHIFSVGLFPFWKRRPS